MAPPQEQPASRHRRARSDRRPFAAIRMPFINARLALLGLVMSAGVSAIKIVLFGTATGFTLRAFEELASHELVVAVVLSGPSRRGWRDLLPRLRSNSPLECAAHARMIPIIRLTDANESAVGEQLSSLRPDVICIATFPRLIPREIFALAPL